MRSFVTNHRGLTLIEVMAVLAVSGLLLVGVWRLYHGGMRAYQGGLRDVQVTQRARTVLRIMTRDIQQALTTALPFGIQGTPQQGAQAEADRLELLALTYPTAESTQGAASLQRIRYRLEAPSAGEAHVLTRMTTATTASATERVIPMSEDVHTLKMRYFDGQMWYDTWQRETLPQALELTVGLAKRGWDARMHYFTTIVTTQ